MPQLIEVVPLLCNAPAGHLEALEQGKILHFTDLDFTLAGPEKRFLVPGLVKPGAKSVSFTPASGVVKHARGGPEDLNAVAAMMKRYADFAAALVTRLFPLYAPALAIGRTSFRPVEISNQQGGWRRDDTRLHVDAFPTTPVGDRRILRVFTNVHPDGQARRWRMGERFEDVALRFVPRARPQIPASAWFLRAAGLTKSTRTAYDHLMLEIHDGMKRDDRYQERFTANDYYFTAGSTWIAFSDQVSHAAISGQHAFEQTFYVPVSAQASPSTAPLRVLERLMGRALV